MKAWAGADEGYRDAFDKTAKLLDIPWLPGLGPGPSLEHYAAPSPSPEINNATETLLVQMPRFKPAVRGQFAFSFAGMKTQVMKETAKHWPNLKMKGMPEHVKRAVARRFQEVSLRWWLMCAGAER